MTANEKTFLELSKDERLLLVQQLQERRKILKESSKKKRAKGSKKSNNNSKNKKAFKFEDPNMQAMFDLLPDDFKKKFGKKL
jgi:hypothetical protein